MLRIQNSVVKNATWIIVCKIIEAILHLIITMLTTRYLGPRNYGVINYAVSVMAFTVPFMHLGVRSILINEFVNAPYRKGETLGTALGMNLVSSFLCVSGIVLFAYIANYNEKETIIVCFLYGISLIFQAIQILQYWFQEQLLSKYVSLSMLLAYILMSVYQVVILVMHKSIYWFASSETIKHMLIAVFLIFQYKKHRGERLVFSFATAKQLFLRGRYYILSNLMMTIFTQTDKIMLKQMLGNEVTGYYGAAVACANISNFVFLAIVDSARPKIFENKKQSEEQFEKSIKYLYSIIFYVSIIQCVAFTLFAKLVVNILYGEQYFPTVLILQIVVWYTVVAHLGLVRDIWILSKDKQRYMWIMNACGAITNVVLNYILIPKFFGAGAAVASLLSQFLAIVGMCWLFKDLRAINKLMFSSLNPRILLEIMRIKK